MDIGWITAAPNGQIPIGDPDQVAFSLENEQEVTYAELLALENCYANGLLELGVGAGDRVGLLLQNSADYVALYFAVARIGAIAVRLNTRLAPDELEFVLIDSETSVLCMHPGFVERIEPIRERLRVRHHLVFGLPTGDQPAWAARGEDLRRHGDGEPAVPRPPGSDPVMLMYTSGTTGFPKAAIWTHETSLGCATSQALELGYGPDTVAMTTGPLYHAGAFEALLLPALMRQGRAVASRSGGFQIERVVEVAISQQVTDFFVYPFMLYDLMRMPGLDAERMPSLRCLFTGGDPIMPWALEAVRERFPGVEVKQGYGLTESTQATCLDHEAGSRHPDSIGRPFPLNEVKVVGEDEVEVPLGEPGEIMVRGLGTTSAYWRRPDVSAETFTADGWLRTGDVGRVEDGLLFLAGRKKDMIRSGGENVSPAEVEKVLTQHPAIADAAVVAVPNRQYLEVGCAVLVLEEGSGLSDEEVFSHCQERLAKYKCPRHAVRVDELPRNASGKVLKNELRERYRSLGRSPDGAAT